MDAALVKAKLEPAAIERVFLTGGSSHPCPVWRTSLEVFGRTL